MSCNNNNHGNKPNVRIKHVFGNVLQLAIPLTLRTLEKVTAIVDEVETDVIQATDTDFIPSSDYPVTVEFKKNGAKVDIAAEMRDGNVAYVEDCGTIPIGTYDITVLCKGDNGKPYRFKQKTVLQVVDTTAEAGITTPIEFETQVWYLDAAIFLALKGDKGDKGDDGADGVGISSISVAESDESHGANIITFYLDDGTRRTFRVLNGIYDDDYNHTDNNYTDEERAIVLGVGARFANIQQLVYMFASSAVRTVVYNPTLKKLVGYPVYDGEGEGNTLFDIDVSDFVRDTHVESAYLNGGIITIEFDTESGKAPISIDLSGYINPSDYYTKTEADKRYAKENELDDFVKLNAAGKLSYAAMPFVVLSSLNLAYNGSANASLVGNAYYCTDGYIRYFYRKDGRINNIYTTPASGVLYLYRQTGDIYIWDATNRVFVPVNSNVDLSLYYTKAQIDAMGVNGIVGLSYDWANYCLSVNKGGGNIESVFVPSLIILAATTSGNTINFYGYSHNYGQSVSYREAADLMTSYRVNVALLIDDRIYHLVNVDSDSDSTYKYAHLDENLVLRTVEITFGSSVTFEGTTTDLTSMFDGGGSGGYEPPTGGIPKSDLSQEVQASLNKADTALQQHQDISGKVDKEQGKGLSTNDYTTAEKDKLAGLSAQVQSDWEETNTRSPAYIKHKPTIPTAINGKSAYQSYLDTTTDNPKKTEVEWVASLKGKQGNNGFSVEETSTAIVFTVWQGATIEETSTKITISA